MFSKDTKWLSTLQCVRCQRTIYKTVLRGGALLQNPPELGGSFSTYVIKQLQPATRLLDLALFIALPT